MKTLSRMTLALAAAALALGGCAVTVSDPARIAVQTAPETWSASSLPAGEIADFKDFWARWSDPDLVRLIERARSTSTDVLTAQANLRSARASLTAANSALWPSFEVNGNSSRRRADHRTSTDYDAGVSGAWTFGLGGTQYWDRRAAEENAVALTLTLSDVRELVAAETAQAYVNLRAAEASLRVVRAMLVNYAETAQTSRWQFEAGTGSASEAEDALVQLASARARIPQIEHSIVEYRNALAKLTALPVDQLGLEETGQIPTPPEGCAALLPAQVLERRPDVRSAQHALAAAVMDLKSAKSRFFPSLSISGSIGTQAATVSALGASGTGIASLIGALSVPILNWGSLIAGEEEAAAALDRAQANYVGVLLDALEETDNALSGISHSERRQENLRSAVLHARSAEMLARQEYEAGIGDYTMLLSTQRSLLSSQESELSNRAERANNYILLYRAIGGGWAVENAARQEAENPEPNSEEKA